jgi:hypothetical protein
MNQPCYAKRTIVTTPTWHSDAKFPLEGSPMDYNGTPGFDEANTQHSAHSEMLRTTLRLDGWSLEITLLQSHGNFIEVYRNADGQVATLCHYEVAAQDDDRTAAVNYDGEVIDWR